MSLVDRDTPGWTDTAALSLDLGAPVEGVADDIEAFLLDPMRP